LYNPVFPVLNNYEKEKLEREAIKKEYLYFIELANNKYLYAKFKIY